MTLIPSRPGQSSRARVASRRKFPDGPQDGILFITDRKFWRRSIGSEQRIAALVLHLARAGFPVTVAYVGRVYGPDRAALDRFADAERNLDIVARATDRTNASRAIRMVRRLVQRISRPQKTAALSASHPGPTHGFKPGTPARRKFVQSIIGKRRPNVVIVEFLRLTYTVHPREENPTKHPLYWVDTHDAMHKRADRYRIAKQAIPNALTARQETGMLATYDAILAIQAREATLFHELLPDKEVLLVPHGVDAPKPLPKRTPPLTSESPGPIRLGFLGGRDVSNQHSLDWFAQAVWPDLRDRFGDRVEFHVAGQVCQHWASNAPGVLCLGIVESAERFWTGIDIAINPIQFGSGLKIKNVEALAYGRALLTTPIGAEGIEPASPDGLGIATTATEWKDLLVRWLGDPEAMARVGRYGRVYADTHLTEDIAFEDLRDRLVHAATERAR